MLLAAAAAIAAVVAATATAKTSAPAARASADTALVKCGKTRSIGLLAPITGPAASLGKYQVDWAAYYVSKYNATHKKTKFKLVRGDTVLGGPGWHGRGREGGAVVRLERAGRCRSCGQQLMSARPRRP